MNSQKYLAVGGKGFCNCFKNLMSVLRLNQNSKTTVQRCGLVLEDQNIMFDSKKDNKSEYLDYRGWRLKVLDSDTDIPVGFCEIYERNHPKWTDSINQDRRHVDHQYLKIPLSFRKKINNLIESRFIVKKFITDVVDGFYKEYGPYDSVHLRTFTPSRTYAMNSRYNYYLQVQKKRYIEEINSCKNKKVFITYDYFPEFEDLITNCKSKEIITFNNLKFNIEDFTEGSINSNDMINDFINLLLLSRGDRMILHELSTYSEVAWFYSKCNEDIIII